MRLPCGHVYGACSLLMIHVGVVTSGQVVLDCITEQNEQTMGAKKPVIRVPLQSLL